MSGPLSMEPPGREDTLSLRLADRPRPTPASTVDHRLAAVDRLAAELADRVAPAVHPYEVAALLESEGLSGDAVREEYGHRDLFSLATALYERVPRAYPEPPSVPDPWRPDVLRCALRGALFALPGAAYLLAGRMLPAGGVPALMVAGIVSWAWGQALAHRAYLALAGGRSAAARTLLVGAPSGAALATGAGAVVSGWGPVVGAVAGQSAYLAAAMVLLVLGHERLLLAMLVPVAAGAAALPWWEPGPLPSVALPALSLVGAVVAAGRILRGALRDDDGADAVRPRHLASLPYGLFGLAAGCLVLLAGRGHFWSVIVLTLSMGPAEWLLYRYRGLSVAALRATRTPAGFRLRSTLVLTGCLLVYLAPLVPAAVLTGAAPKTLLSLAAVLWTSLLLQAFGVAWPPALLCLAAAGTAGLFLLSDAPADPAVLPLTCAVAGVCLVVCAVRLLGRPAAHA
ncbi:MULTISPECIES: hypothetical protein [unclassified Streptomyces]|uniref:hypothetical protein n=1 Tax=unclassified Streptomyces TaxID=2593676 RepID=UPI0019045D5D|nr:hypothetical protein [Streptomyces sp. HSG2]